MCVCVCVCVCACATGCGHSYALIIKNHVAWKIFHAESGHGVCEEVGEQVQYEKVSVGVVSSGAAAGLADQPPLFLGSHFDAVTAVAFHPTDHVLVTGSEDCTLKLWNLQKASETRK